MAEVWRGVSLAAAVVLFDGKGRVLLVHQNYGRRRWSLPGGVLEPGESPHVAAVREVFEETRVTVELRYVIGLYFLRHDNPGIGFLFLGDIPDTQRPASRSDEIDEIGWFDPGSLPIPAVEGLSTVVQDAVDGQIGCFRGIDARPAWRSGTSRHEREANRGVLEEAGAELVR